MEEETAERETTLGMVYEEVEGQTENLNRVNKVRVIRRNIPMRYPRGSLTSVRKCGRVQPFFQPQRLSASLRPSPTGMKYVALLSGGKDSCFNLLHCAKNGHELVAAASLGPEPGKG